MDVTHIRLASRLDSESGSAPLMTGRLDFQIRSSSFSRLNPIYQRRGDRAEVTISQNDNRRAHTILGIRFDPSRDDCDRMRLATARPNEP